MLGVGLFSALSLLLLCGLAMLLVQLDRILWNALLTPTFLLVVPYTIVVLLAALFAESLGFYRFNVASILVWLIGIVLFWTTGGFISFALTAKGRLRKRSLFKFESNSQKLALWLLWFIYPLLLFRLVSMLGSLGGIQGLASDEFTRLYGRGPFAHLMVFSYPLLILLMGTVTRKQILVIATIVIGFVLISVYQVKSWLFVPILAALLYRWSSGRLILSIRLIIIFALFAVGLFFTSYLIGFGARDPSVLVSPAVYSFLAGHFAAYLFAGVMSFGQALKYGMEFDLSSAQVFAPFVNVYNVLTGRELISQINPNFLTISYLGQTSNVNTLFGTLFLMLGGPGGALYAVLMGLIVNTTYLIARVSANCWFNVLWGFIGAMLALGWFDFYFSNLNAFEVPAFCLILGIGCEFLYLVGRSRSGDHFHRPTVKKCRQDADVKIS